ncbi:hypothetical protein [uncultured Clostridium sp.]|uniref:hypothetical protein n=1 Tax=uncultured Clostridium sp. TaxID=59620 RepID=UPI002671D7E9|nr:hypothetical protein [uncultured Clostridium sp.]
MENVLNSNKENKIENNNTEENIETSNEVITEKLETKGLKLKRNTKNRLNDLQSKFDDAESMVSALLDQYEVFKITEDTKFADRKTEIEKFTYLLDSIKNSYINSLEMASFLEEKQIEKSMMEIKNRDKTIVRLQQTITKKEEKIKEIENTLLENNKELNTVKDSFSRVNLALTTVEKELKEKADIIKSSQMHIESLNALLEEEKRSNKVAKEYKVKLESLEERYKDYELIKEKLQITKEDQRGSREEIISLKAEIKEYREYSNSLNDKIHKILNDKTEEISNLKDQFRSEIIETERGFNEKLKEKDLVIEKLKEEIFKLKLSMQNKKF